MKFTRKLFTCLLILQISNGFAMVDHLLDAINNCNINQIEALLLEKNPNYYSNSDEHTPLTLACAKQNSVIIKILLNSGAGTDYQHMGAKGEPVHMTALTTAALTGNIDICRLLIEHGANTNPRNPFALSPLHAATRTGNPRLMQLLIAHGAKLDAENVFGITPLHETILHDNKNDHYPACVCLLRAGANPDVQTLYHDKVSNTHQRDKTPLMLAAMYGKKLFFTALIMYKANINIGDRHHYPPYFVQVFKENLDILDI